MTTTKENEEVLTGYYEFSYKDRDTVYVLKNPVLTTVVINNTLITHGLMSNYIVKNGTLKSFAKGGYFGFDNMSYFKKMSKSYRPFRKRKTKV